VSRVRCRFDQRGRRRAAQALPVRLAEAITTRKRTGKPKSLIRNRWWIAFRAVVKTSESPSLYACVTSVLPVGLLVVSKYIKYTKKLACVVKREGSVHVVG